MSSPECIVYLLSVASWQKLQTSCDEDARNVSLTLSATLSGFFFFAGCVRGFMGNAHALSPYGSFRFPSSTDFSDKTIERVASWKGFAEVAFVNLYAGLDRLYRETKPRGIKHVKLQACECTSAYSA